MNTSRFLLALAVTTIGTAEVAADRPKFPAGIYILSCSAQPLTGKHAVEVKQPFVLQPGQYILSGGPDPTEQILVDDDLELLIGGRKVFIDDDHFRTWEGRDKPYMTYHGDPIILALTPKTKLTVRGIDCAAVDAVMGNLYLHRYDGAKVQFVKEIKEHSADELPNVFFEKEFGIDKLFPTPPTDSGAAKLTDQQLQTAWKELASLDEIPAYFALWRLVASPTQSVPFLNEKVKPATEPDPRQLLQLLADLGDVSFRVREQAMRTLERKDTRAKPGLREAMQRDLSPEARRRMERLMAQIRSAARPPEVIQALRAVEVLSRIGSPEAKAMLEELAKGAESALTKEAKTALQRRKQ